MTEVNNLDDITQQSNANNTDTNQNNNQNNNNQNNAGSAVMVGCDINGNDAECQNTVAQIITQGGYQVEKLAIDPNAFATASYDSANKDKIGVYLMADSIFSIGDFAFGGTSMKYAYFGIRGDLGLPRMSTQEDFDNNPLSPDADCRGGVCDKLAGKSYKQINDIVKDKCQAVFGKTPEELGQNILAAMGGQAQGGAASAGGGGAVLIPNKTFYGLIQQIAGAVDAIFVTANNMAYLLSFKDVYEYRNQFDEIIPKIERKHVLENSVVKNWSNNGFYNAVEVTYADGIVKYQNDDLVKQYGENVFYYEFPEDDEETAKAKADALLAAHIRDYSTEIQLSVFYNEHITEGSWVKVHKTITQISGKTHREIQQEELKKQGQKISTKHKGLTIENFIEKTITDKNNVKKTIQSIKDEEGEKYDIEIEKSDYELFFVQSYTCRWDKDNALIMDLQLKYGPDTPDDPINATIGSMGASTGGATAIGGQAADINEFVKKALQGVPNDDRSKAEAIYKAMVNVVRYSLYECSHYQTPSECLQNAGHLNCADSSRLGRACYAAGGLQAQVVHGPDHFWVEVNIGGQIVASDVTGPEGGACVRPLGEVYDGRVKDGDCGENPSC